MKQMINALAILECFTVILYDTTCDAVDVSLGHKQNVFSEI